MHFLLRLAIAVSCLVVGGLVATMALAGGGGTRTTLYVTRDSTPDLPRAAIRFDDVLYALNTVQGKYKVVPVMLESGPEGSPVSLSRDADAFSISAGGRTIQGILDLAKADPELWGSLETPLKEALLYPAGLEPEEMRTIYILAPASEMQGLPDSFSLFIKSLDHTLEIQKSAPMAE